MRILEFVISLEKGGRTQRALQLTRHLLRSGHQVSVLVLQAPPQWVQQDLLTDIDWHCIVRREGIDLRLMWQLFHYVRQEKFSVIHAHCESSMLYGGLVGKLLSIPVLVTYHRSVLNAYSSRWQWRFMAKLFSAIVAVSSQRANLLRSNLRIPDNKLQIIHGAIEFDQFPEPDLNARESAREVLGLTQEKIIWFSAGHLGEIKGHDDTIRALALLQDELPVRLYIAGDGEPHDYHRLKTLAAELSVAERVVFLSQINNIPLWLAACNIFVQPSREEAFGLVFVEAGAAQRPVVATHVGGIPDIIIHEKTGLLVAPRAPIELAAALLLLSKNKVLADTMGVAARQRALKYFTLEHMYKQYESLLQKLIYKS